jgi:hypothetical protein
MNMEGKLTITEEEMKAIMQERMNRTAPGLNAVVTDVNSRYGKFEVNFECCKPEPAALPDSVTLPALADEDVAEECLGDCGDCGAAGSDCEGRKLEAGLQNETA